MYKDTIQSYAEEIALELYGKEFYELEPDLRDDIYFRAQAQHRNYLKHLADAIYEKIREGNYVRYLNQTRGS